MNPETITLDQASTLEAGPWTDALIAAMCGKQLGDHELWSPSTDANDSIEAAAGIMLLEDQHSNAWAITFTLYEWRVVALRNGDIASAETPALALCRARACYHVQERDRKANAKTIAGDVP